MTKLLERHTNPLNYPELPVVDGFRPLGDKVLIQWEKSNDFVKDGKILLIRPETMKGTHYTGIVLAVGPEVVSDKIQVGHRVLFEQFCNFKKLFNEQWGRLAIVKEWNIVALVPARLEIQSGEEDFDYSR